MTVVLSVVPCVPPIETMPWTFPSATSRVTIVVAPSAMTGAATSRSGAPGSCASGMPPASATSARVMSAGMAGVPTTPVSMISAASPNFSICSRR